MSANPRINVGQPQDTAATDGEIQLGMAPGRLTNEPLPLGGAAGVIDAVFILGDQQLFAQRWDAPVNRELAGAVVTLR